MVEDKTGKEDIPMSETGTNAIYAQPNKVSKGPKSEVEDISSTENLYAQVKKPDKKWTFLECGSLAGYIIQGKTFPKTVGTTSFVWPETS